MKSEILKSDQTKSGLENSVFGTGQVSGVARAYTVLGLTGVVFVYIPRLLTSLSFPGQSCVFSAALLGVG